MHETEKKTTATQNIRCV